MHSKKIVENIVKKLWSWPLSEGRSGWSGKWKFSGWSGQISGLVAWLAVSFIYIIFFFNKINQKRKANHVGLSLLMAKVVGFLDKLPFSGLISVTNPPLSSKVLIKNNFGKLVIFYIIYLKVYTFYERIHVQNIIISIFFKITVQMIIIRAFGHPIRSVYVCHWMWR